MTAISSVAVFCGSRLGTDPRCAAASRELGLGLARAGIRLVYGAGKNGMMGVLADAVLEGGGQVLGVIPGFMRQWEVAHPGLTEIVVTETMHERKSRMAEEAGAFVAMPGGIGTLDETIEILSWRQLRLHSKPIFICDIAGWAAPFAAAVEAAVAQGFAGPEVREYLTVVDSVPALLEQLSRAAAGTGPDATRL